MKITLVNTLYYPYQVGGAEKSVQMLAETYVSMGYEVSVICLHEGSDRKISNINGVQVFYLPIRNIYWPFSKSQRTVWGKFFWHIKDYYNINASKDVGEVLDQICPDVVHTNNLSGFSVSVWSAIKKRGIKLVHTSRDYYLFHPKSTLFDEVKYKNILPSSFFVRVWSLMRKFKSSHVDAYVGISEFIRDFHKDNGFFRGKKSIAIYNAIEKLSVTTIGDKNKPKGVGFIGTLTKNKGFFDFCELAKNHPHVQFYVAGDFKCKSDEYLYYEKFSQNNIKLLGYTDFITFSTFVDRVVLPLKWNEPFGRVIVECSINDISVYTTPVGGAKELMTILPNVHEISSFTGESEPKCSKQIPVEIFCKKEIAKQYLDLYRNV